jgi:eukaryotic-like serine/threonine-protein kinase
LRLAEEARGKSPDPAIALLAGRVLVLAGKPARALEIAADLGNSLENESQMYARLLEGEAALGRADAREAVSAFKAAQKISDSWIGHYGLGRAYLAAGVYTDAQTEFDACLSRRGEATTMLLDDIPTYRFMTWTRYYMARAQQGQGSSAAAAAAAESYKAFLDIKSKGDEQGLVADARRRAASK